jgi:hypothetical protein
VTTPWPYKILRNTRQYVFQNHPNNPKKHHNHPVPSYPMAMRCTKPKVSALDYYPTSFPSDAAPSNMISDFYEDDDEEDDFDSYPLGQTFTLKQHIPGPACPDSDCTTYLEPEWKYENVSQFEWCLDHPPSTGSTNSRQKRKVTFTENIRTGRQCGAQVLLTDDGLVAKIYDPLHYGFYDLDDESGGPSSLKVDVTAAADHDYSAEANAYSAMIGSGVQGGVMPTYYGSWTFEVGTVVGGQEYTREVHMILVEHIVGIPMLHIDTYDLTDEQKENIVHKALEAETDLRIAGINHFDFEPRNIMVAPSVQLPKGILYNTTSLECPDLRVCVIDFAMASVRKKPVPVKRRNPLFKWAGYQPWAEDDWCSDDQEEVADWMWEKWGNGAKAEKYVPVTRDMGDARSRPLERFQ